MKSRKTIVFFLVVILALLMGLTQHSYALEDAIVAIVNDDIITFKDFSDYLNSIYVKLKMSQEPPEKIQRIMQEMEKNGVNRLIEDKLILSKANELGVTIRTDAIDNKLSQIKSQYSSEDEFLAAIINDGTTITDLRNKISDDLKMQHLVEVSVRSKIYVSPQEITEYFNENNMDFKKPERIKLESIYIPYDDNRKEAFNLAKEAIAFLENNGDFSQIAKQYSKSPSLGTIAKGEMIPEIEDVVFKLKEGEISEITEIQNGFYIFKVTKKLPPEAPTLHEVKEKVSSIVYQKKFKLRFDEWMEELKKDAFIEIRN